MIPQYTKNALAIAYNSNFLTVADSQRLYNNLLINSHWLEVKQARKEMFLSRDIFRTYFYGNEDYEYTSSPYTSEVREISDLIGDDYNVCFLNRYDNQHQALGWHADDSPNVDPNHPIAVVSLGAEREIWIKPQGYKGVIPECNKQLLHNGSLFIMPPQFQQNFFHKIPKHSRECGTRISLTFRRYVD